MDHDTQTADLALVNRRISEATLETQRLRAKVAALEAARQDASAYRRLLGIADETLEGLRAERRVLIAAAGAAPGEGG